MDPFGIVVWDWRDDHLTWDGPVAPAIALLSVLSCGVALAAIAGSSELRKEPSSCCLMLWAAAQGAFQLTSLTGWIVKEETEIGSGGCIALWFLERTTFVISTGAVVALWVNTVSSPFGGCESLCVAVALVDSALVLYGPSLLVGGEFVKVHKYSCEISGHNTTAWELYFNIIFIVVYIIAVQPLAPLIVGVAVVRLCCIARELPQEAGVRMLATFLLVFMAVSLPCVVTGVLSLFATDKGFFDVISRYCVLVQPIALLASLCTSPIFRRALKGIVVRQQSPDSSQGDTMIPMTHI